MAKKIYSEVGGTSRNVPSFYTDVNNKSRKVTKGYVEVNGKARMFYLYSAPVVPDPEPDTPVTPSEPSNYRFKVAYTSNTTWTSDKDQYIRVHVFGKCGDGASVEEYSKGGSGGNSGGYACSVLLVQKGQSVSCTFTNGVAKFGDYLYATAGDNGGGSYVGKTVGQGYNGNRYNLSGFKGGLGGDSEKNGAAGENNGASGGSKNYAGSASSGGGGGGGGARLPVPYTNFPYVPNSLSSYKGGTGAGWWEDSDEERYDEPATDGSSYPTLNLSAPMLYGGGNGGGGGCEYYWQEEWDSPTQTDYTDGGKGSAGSPACIIIEVGA